MRCPVFQDVPRREHGHFLPFRKANTVGQHHDTILHPAPGNHDGTSS
jgi:hypothetical protein